MHVCECLVCSYVELKLMRAISAMHYSIESDSTLVIHDILVSLLFIITLTGTRTCHCNGTRGSVHCIDTFTIVQELVRLITSCIHYACERTFSQTALSSQTLSCITLVLDHAWSILQLVDSYTYGITSSPGCLL